MTKDYFEHFRNMLILLLFLQALLVMGGIASCTLKGRGLVYDIHDKEFCVADDDLKLQCVNKNLDKQTYERELQPGDVITNSNDAMRATTELIDIISDLKRCQSEG